MSTDGLVVTNDGWIVNIITKSRQKEQTAKTTIDVICHCYHDSSALVPCLVHEKLHSLDTAAQIF